MKKTYQKLSLVPLGIKVESSLLQQSIEVEAEIQVKAYQNGFKDYIGTDGFDSEGSYTINF